MDLFLLLVQLDADVPIERALETLGATAAQVTFGHILPHQFSPAGYFEPFRRGFMCLEFWHNSSRKNTPRSRRARIMVTDSRNCN